jgi:hypothetical protein
MLHKLTALAAVMALALPTAHAQDDDEDEPGPAGPSRSTSATSASTACKPFQELVDADPEGGVLKVRRRALRRAGGDESR